MQNLVSRSQLRSPREKKEIFVELAKKTLQRSFSSEELRYPSRSVREVCQKRRRRAWDTFDSPSEDALAQAAHSMRDILGLIIAKLGSNERVKACDWLITQETRTFLIEYAFFCMALKTISRTRILICRLSNTEYNFRAQGSD